MHHTFFPYEEIQIIIKQENNHTSFKQNKEYCMN
jgi:hypothetical protein